jgi:hypothetical protein
MTERTEHFSTDGDVILKVRLPAGSLVVRDGESGSVEVIARGPNPDQLTIERHGSEIVIEHDPRVLLGRASHDIEVFCGGSVAILAKTGAADVTIDRRVDDATIETASGDVSAVAIEDSADIRTASGDISVHVLHEYARIRTASGDVRVGRADNGASIVSASGDVRVEDSPGDLTIKTASGAIVVGRFAGYAFNAKSMSGDIRIEVPSGRRVQVDLQTLSGDVRLPSAPSGTPGDGGERLRLRARTVSGDVIVTSAHDGTTAPVVAD